MDLTFQWPDGAPVDAWPYFPGPKVGKIYLYSSIWTILGELIYKSLVRSAIIPEL
jgi:hypothetical protein